MLDNYLTLMYYNYIERKQPHGATNMNAQTSYATFATFSRETDKAVLHTEFGWMPKSQITVFNTPMGKMVAVPNWLKAKVSRSDYRYGRRCWFVVTDGEIEANLVSGQ